MPRLLLAVILPLALGCAVVVVAQAGTSDGRTDRAAAPPAARAPAAAGPAAPLRTVAQTILRSWDERRAEAWARGDGAALARLYVRGSAAGRRDLAMLRRWSARGLVVEGLRVQLLAVEVWSWTPGRLALEVTDRLAGGTAVGRDTRVALPVDAATTRVLVLRRVAGEWRVSRVRVAGAVSAPR